MSEKLEREIIYKRGVENGQVWYSESLNGAIIKIYAGQELTERTCYVIDLQVRLKEGYPPKGADEETKQAHLEKINEKRSQKAFEVYEKRIAASDV